MPRDAAVSRLIDSLHETLKYFDQPVATMERSYGPGKWTLREILVHLSDTETVLLDRLRRLAAEEKPLLTAFDENRWASTLFYKQRDLNLARAQFEAARRGIIELVRTLPDSFDSKTGMHSEAGPLTFGQMLEKVGSHNVHHLEQIKAIAEGRTWLKQ
ncbi:MAG TPA: DinB family protein [Planctomycetota bacterium]|nr:DinB family protein [Planctomycetota bacterium]